MTSASQLVQFFIKPEHINPGDMIKHKPTNSIGIVGKSEYINRIENVRMFQLHPSSGVRVIPVESFEDWELLMKKSEIHELALKTILEA